MMHRSVAVGVAALWPQIGQTYMASLKDFGAACNILIHNLQHDLHKKDPLTLCCRSMQCRAEL